MISQRTSCTFSLKYIRIWLGSVGEMPCLKAFPMREMNIKGNLRRAVGTNIVETRFNSDVGRDGCASSGDVVLDEIPCLKLRSSADCRKGHMAQ